MNLEFEKLENDFGARIHGLSQHCDVDEELVQALTVGLAEHGVLLMRGDEISPNRLVDLGRAFGE